MLFLGKFGPTNQTGHFKLKFGTQTNSNKQNSMMVFTFSFLDRKHPFWLTKVNKVRLCLWNLVGVQNLKQAAVVNTAFLFCSGECVRGLFLGTALNIFK